MARVRITYGWSTGEQLEVDVESDLDTIAEVGSAAVDDFRGAWSALEPSE